ncbi:glycerol-3-phosphate dehydrogenase 1-like protein [Sycon ciliatum]|uniref:glycerol-3-phosphate dehydrogenase 1-like protein n=1 Tax=Sycon ciliatum TaxID=27933 RepID=UPI0031F5F47B
MQGRKAFVRQLSSLPGSTNPVSCHTRLVCQSLWTVDLVAPLPYSRFFRNSVRNWTNSTSPTLIRMADRKWKVCLIGSGNWGSAIAKIVGENVQHHNDFENDINMWVFEEQVDGRNLTDIINTEHENVKYLPGIKLPSNVRAVPNVVDAVQDATILVFVLPHQFVKRICSQIGGKIAPGAMAISLIKGVDEAKGGLELTSTVIERELGLDVAVLMGANIANEVAREQFCETTIGCRSDVMGPILKRAFETPYFRVALTHDVYTVELCGALKNIVACAAGFADGLGFGSNTKAAIIRIGMMEMIEFARMFYDGVRDVTFFQSCGVADLITTCYGGRNRKVSEALVRTGKTLDELEKEMLGGQKLQGPPTALEVHKLLAEKNIVDKFPLFRNVHSICYNNAPGSSVLDGLIGSRL